MTPDPEHELQDLRRANCALALERERLLAAMRRVVATMPPGLHPDHDWRLVCNIDTNFALALRELAAQFQAAQKEPNQ